MSLQQQDEKQKVLKLNIVVRILMAVRYYRSTSFLRSRRAAQALYLEDQHPFTNLQEIPLRNAKLEC